MTHQGKIDRKALRIYKANLRFLHDKYSNAEMDIMFELAAAQRGAGREWMPYLNILVKRATDAGLLALVKPEGGGGVRIMGVDTTPVYIVITDAGRAFVAELGLKEL